MNCAKSRRILEDHETQLLEAWNETEYTTPPDVRVVHINDERLAFDLEDGRSISVPLSFYPTLILATPEERSEYEICHSSVHWPKLDCDISSDCLLRGAKEARRYAERAWRRRR